MVGRSSRGTICCGRSSTVLLSSGYRLRLLLGGVGRIATIAKACGAGRGDTTAAVVAARAIEAVRGAASIAAVAAIAAIGAAVVHVLLRPRRALVVAHRVKAVAERRAIASMGLLMVVVAVLRIHVF